MGGQRTAEWVRGMRRREEERARHKAEGCQWAPLDDLYLCRICSKTKARDWKPRRIALS